MGNDGKRLVIWGLSDLSDPPRHTTLHEKRRAQNGILLEIKKNMMEFFLEFRLVV